MKINYCLPILSKNKNEILQIIADYKNDYQYFEVWLDYIENVDEEFIKIMINKLQEKLIILFRRKNLETIKMDLARRQDIIFLINNSHSFIDLDLSQQEEINYLKNNNLNCNLIISYHNYQETPSNEKLQNIIDEMIKIDPDIYKISAFCKSEEDAIRLMQLQLKLKKENKKHIILGMGEFGTITRVYGSLWGNEMIFAPKTTEENSAPGQLTKDQLDKIFNELITNN